MNLQMWNWQGLDVINAHERASAVYAAGMREAGKRRILGAHTHRHRAGQLEAALRALR